MLVTLIRAIILYLVLVLMVRLMGKRQISQMQPFELVIALMIADLAAVPMQDLGLPLISGIIPVVALVVMHNVIGLLILRFGAFRKLFCGRPYVLIENGIVQEENMKKLNLHIGDLTEGLHSQGVESVSQVMHCVIENNGSLSVLLKGEEQPVTAKQIGISPQEPELYYAVMFDGTFDADNLKQLNMSKLELIQSLRTLGLLPKEVYVAIADKAGNLRIQQKRTRIIYLGKVKKQ